MKINSSWNAQVKYIHNWQHFRNQQSVDIVHHYFHRKEAIDRSILKLNPKLNHSQYRKLYVLGVLKNQNLSPHLLPNLVLLFCYQGKMISKSRRVIKYPGCQLGHYPDKKPTI